MNLVALRAKARRTAGTDSGNYSDVNVDLDINIYQGKALLLILQAQGWKVTEKYATIDLATDVRKYPLDLSYLTITKCELLQPDGTYLEMDETDVRDVKSTDEASIRAQFAGKPGFSISGNSIRIWTDAVTDTPDGLKIWFDKTAPTITTTQDPIIVEGCQGYLYVGAAYDYCREKQKSRAGQLKLDLAEEEVKLTDHYANKETSEQAQIETVWRSSK